MHLLSPALTVRRCRQLGRAMKLQGKTDEAEAAYLRAFIINPATLDTLQELAALGWPHAQVAELRILVASDTHPPALVPEARFGDGPRSGTEELSPRALDPLSTNPKCGSVLVDPAVNGQSALSQTPAQTHEIEPLREAYNGSTFFHAYNCGWFTPNGSDQWFYVYPQEGGIWFVINNIYVALGLNVACADANLEAVHVINSNTGAFDQTESWPYRP